MEDYYSILGVSKSASDQEIKSAYRKKALEYHPDRNKSADATEKFKNLNKAYEVLSDGNKRKLYDQYGHAAFERGATGQSGSAGGWSDSGPFSYYTNMGGSGFNVDFDFDGSNPFDIFEEFFGFGRNNSKKRRSIYEMHITFDEAVKGVEKSAVINGETKNIKIPAGVDTGMKIRFNDFDVQVNVKSHDFFKRDGQDIYIDKEISFKDAILGTALNVPTVDGNIKVKIRPGTKSGAVMRLKGKGVVYPNSSNRRGDQYIVFNVKIPSKVTSKGKKLLEELDKEIS